MMFKHLCRALVGVALLAVWAAITVLPASASELYNQPTNYLGAYASQNDTAPSGFGNFATAYDIFTLGSSSSITSVAWVGSYFNPGTPGTITGFTLDFYANSSGAPGALMATTGDVAGNAGETFLQDDYYGDPTYSYSLGLSVPFTVSGGTPYWLSIVPDESFPPQWGWEIGTGGDGRGYQCFYGACSSQGVDFAFTLNGNTVSAIPEPGTLTLLGTFLFLAARRRKAS